MTQRILLVTALLLVACNSSGSDDSAAATNEPAVEAEAAASEDEAQVEEAQADDQEPTTMPSEADPHAGHEMADEDHANAPGMEHVRREGEYDPADLVGQPGAAIGDLTTCPVSGEVFEVTEDAPYIEHGGQNVYFCCARCIRRFQRNPDEYLGAMAEPAGTEGGEMVEVTAEGSRFAALSAACTCSRIEWPFGHRLRPRSRAPSIADDPGNLH